MPMDVGTYSPACQALASSSLALVVLVIGVDADVDGSC